MTLVQIDLRPGRDSRPLPAAPAAGIVVAAAEVAVAEHRRAASPAVVLGIGLILIVPLAATALHSVPAVVLLLVGLGMLGLIAALLRPNNAEVDR